MSDEQEWGAALLFSVRPSDRALAGWAPAGRAAEWLTRLASAESVCVCGHEYRAHRHYRRGLDCSLCGCRRFRQALQEG